MKNFKHGFKTTNKMKLAAVASAAIMLAPVAMSSVSTFAAGYTRTNYQGKQKDTYYPPYQVQSLTAAAAATGTQNGTNGDISSSMNQGATVGYTDAALAAAMKAIDDIKAPALPTNPPAANTAADATQQAAQAVIASVGPAWQAANTLVNAVGHTDDANQYYAQLSAANQVAQDKNVATIQTKLAQLNLYLTADSTAQKPLTDAAKAVDNLRDAAAAANATQTDRDRYAAAVNTYNRAVQTYVKGASKGFHSLVTAYNQWNSTIGLKTNNGSVADAAKNAARAIEKLPAGSLRNRLTAQFGTVQGTYANVTADQIAGDAEHGVPNNQDAVNNMTKAAQTAVAQLNNLAGEASKATDTTATNKNAQFGVVKVNYPAGYGIQIWTAKGKIVRYNRVEALTATDPQGKAVKVGDAKKLAGQKTFKVFLVNGQQKVTMNGTTYYNLGGDQYIDAAYVTFSALK